MDQSCSNECHLLAQLTRVSTITCLPSRLASISISNDFNIFDFTKLIEELSHLQLGHLYYFN